MRAMLVLVIVVCASLMLVSCAPPKVDMGALKKTVDAYNAASADAMMSGSSEKIMSYYDENALEMAPNMPIMKGKAAIKEFQSQMMKSGMKFTSASFTTTELDADGKLAVEIGKYDLAFALPQGGEMKDQGKYVAIWKQQADGSWKVYAETWNSDAPAPPAGQAPEKKPEKGM